jgi:hypothetical protein
MLLWSIPHLAGLQAVNADYELLGRNVSHRKDLELDSLCWIWDNNHITIEGSAAHGEPVGDEAVRPSRQDSRSPRGITSGEEAQSHDYCHFPNS